ncbi:MAG: hypothetical protein WC843_06285 [Candidatus Gracilibacteria bacterium]|jgi:hypothetical protein
MTKQFVTFFNLWILLWNLIGFAGPSTSSLQASISSAGSANTAGFNGSSIATLGSSLNQLLENNALAKTKYIEYNQFVSGSNVGDDNYAKGIENLGINLHSGPESVSSDSTGSLNHCESLAYRTLLSLPKKATAHLQNLTLSFSADARRGLGGGSTVILRCVGVTDTELVSVLVHEMGHIVDTGVVEGNSSSEESDFQDGNNPVYKDDPSLEFYSLSFLDEKTLRPDASRMDFVSGYAMSDPFEDFAETYNYYILHGGEFRKLGTQNKVLQAKYNYLKTRIFHGEEFFNDDEKRLGITTQVGAVERNYDATLIPYDLNKFFGT